MKEKKPDHTDQETGYEVEDLSIRGMVIFGIGLVVVIIITGAAVLGLFNLFNTWQMAGSEPPPPLLQEANPVPPQPRLQRVPGREMEQLRAIDEATLNSYEWIDEEAGVVRIPIERAMELTLERGLPTRSNKAGE